MRWQRMLAAEVCVRGWVSVWVIERTDGIDARWGGGVDGMGGTSGGGLQLWQDEAMRTAIKAHTASRAESPARAMHRESRSRRVRDGGMRWRGGGVAMQGI